jgi:hypothetical protein
VSDAALAFALYLAASVAAIGWLVSSLDRELGRTWTRYRLSPADVARLEDRSDIDEWVAGIRSGPPVTFTVHFPFDDDGKTAEMEP